MVRSFFNLKQIKMKKIFGVSLAIMLLLGSIPSYSYVVEGTFQNIRQYGTEISWDCLYSGSCFSGEGAGPSVGDRIDINLSGEWYCCITITAVPTSSSDPSSDDNGKTYKGQVLEGSELAGVLGL